MWDLVIARPTLVRPSCQSWVQFTKAANVDRYTTLCLEVLTGEAMREWPRHRSYQYSASCCRVTTEDLRTLTASFKTPTIFTNQTYWAEKIDARQGKSSRPVKVHRGSGLTSSSPGYHTGEECLMFTGSLIVDSLVDDRQLQLSVDI